MKALYSNEALSESEKSYLNTVKHHGALGSFLSFLSEQELSSKILVIHRHLFSSFILFYPEYRQKKDPRQESLVSFLNFWILKEEKDFLKYPGADSLFTNINTSISICTTFSKEYAEYTANWITWLSSEKFNDLKNDSELREIDSIIDFFNFLEKKQKANPESDIKNIIESVKFFANTYKVYKNNLENDPVKSSKSGSQQGSFFSNLFSSKPKKASYSAPTPS